MRFGPVNLSDAEGAILAHRTAGVPKGTVLKAAHIAALKEAGKSDIIVAVLDRTDLHEDAAAERVARSVAVGEGLKLTRAHTGRVNVVATCPGLARINAEAIEALNQVDPMITIATVPDLHRVEANDLIATIKIISYGVSSAHVEEAARLGVAALGLYLPVPQTVGLIETKLDGQGRAVRSSKGQRAIADRLERLGLSLDKVIEVPHRAEALSEAISEIGTDTIAILTASATSDRRDIGPSALEAAGGRLIQFGMPVDPGNLLFLGSLGEQTVVGLPGCARSPALNGADWVLERVLCGLTLGPSDFAQMGVGGLLKDIPLRGKPRREVG